MACYNYVEFDCPHCGEVDVQQTKSGSCDFTRRHFTEADPLDVAECEGLNTCHVCGEVYRVNVQFLTSISKYTPNPEET
ncbi:MAG: hypothetical protein AAF658_21995, partial [Myxococcota bacterium]